MRDRMPVVQEDEQIIDPDPPPKPQPKNRGRPRIQRNPVDIPGVNSKPRHVLASNKKKPREIKKPPEPDPEPEKEPEHLQPEVLGLAQEVF